MYARTLRTYSVKREFEVGVSCMRRWVKVAVFP